jgi:hypothetical protein
MANWTNRIGNWFSGYIKASGLFKNHIVVNKVQVSPVQRISLDIQNFKNALVAAEGWGQQRKQLLDIYANLLIDEQVMEGIKRRRRAVCKDLTIMLDGKELEDVERLTRKSFFHTAIKAVVDARIWGHSLLELDWNTNAEGTTAVIDRRHVKPRFGVVTVQPFDVDGMPYREKPFSKMCIEAGDDEDLGDLLQCCIPAILRRLNYSDWAEFAETMGIPIKEGKYNNEEARGILEEAFEKMGAAGWIVVPDGAEFKIHSPPNVGQNTTIFDALHKACSNSIALALLGNSMTTNEATTGGYAQGKVQQDGEDEVKEDDRTYVLQWLNEKLTPYLRSIGYNIPDGAEWCYEQEEHMTKLDKLKVLEGMHRMGVPVGMTTIYEWMGIPMPSADDLPPEQEEDDDDEEAKPKPAK